MEPKKCNTAEEAVSIIESDDFVWTHSMAATPVVLLEALYKHAMSKKNITVMQLHTEQPSTGDPNELKGHIRNRCFFVGAPTRKLVQSGHADYIPIFLSEVPLLFRRGHQKVDAVIVQVSPPDKHGLCTLGISVEATVAAIEKAKKVIAHVNPNMPRTHGDSFIPYELFDTVYEEATPIHKHKQAEQNDVTKKIGQIIADLVEDRSCLQMGIGAIPDAALAAMSNHKDLGIHTEMFSDGVLDLVEKGIVSNRFKEKHPHKIVTSFAMGSQKLYDFIDDNPEVVFLDVGYTNSTQVIRQNSRTVAMNSAIQVDITGQVCADSLGPKIYSGVGGQMDFIRGAALSEGGKAIIALPSTAKNDTISRIAPMLALGSGVVTTRAHVHYIITEYGVADLHGKSLRERAKALIDIAHPKFRDELEKAASEVWELHL
ncbi:MAG: acetyl-CoA hydrolase/transferase family protein [Calditrichaeota bacterium]|nr:MAG: acetyl-CoA hydrolase/transferase family protein [Calditrichota bacterium]MBL1206100.1 acetyl-CoA hydrolase/transferase family protein [Calditrichota bacterium]NOG45926.1 acetyl-CoA hydrolase/transferase family protein [Calditrichota bacterium]